jgi:hypothetical protein
MGGLTITFDNAGMPNLVAGLLTISFDSNALPAAQSNDLNVQINFGGAVRICDPNVSAPPRACN